jgi:hypothetical protein
VACTLVDDYDVIELLDRLAGYRVELLAADAAGILLVDPQRGLRVVVASSDEDAELMELLQLQADQGPCVDCVRTGAPVGEPGRHGRAVAGSRRGDDGSGVFRSVQALPLRLRGEAIGALNLFHHQPGALPEADLVLARRWPTWRPSGSCPNGLSAAGRCSTNHRVLSSRGLIEEAKGVIAQHGGLSMNTAFDRLHRYSRNRHQRLSHVARQVVVATCARRRSTSRPRRPADHAARVPPCSHPPCPTFPPRSGRPRPHTPCRSGG